MRRTADMSKPWNRVCGKCRHLGFCMLCANPLSPKFALVVTRTMRCNEFAPDEKHGGTP